MQNSKRYHQLKSYLTVKLKNTENDAVCQSRCLGGYSSPFFFSPLTLFFISIPPFSCHTRILPSPNSPLHSWPLENILNSTLKYVSSSVMLEKENRLLELGYVMTKQSKMNWNLWASVMNNEKCKCSRPWVPTVFMISHFVFRCTSVHSVWLLASSVSLSHPFNHFVNNVTVLKLYSSRPLMR